MPRLPQVAALVQVQPDGGKIGTVRGEVPARTMEQLESQIPAADLVLDDDILDRIDDIVSPGTTIARGDLAFEPRAVRHKRLRRPDGAVAAGD